MAIVRKTVIYGTERTEDSTILGVAVIDYDEADPSASKQVGQSMSVEVKDDPDVVQDESWLDALLERTRDSILEPIKSERLEQIAKRKMAHHG